jgi:hypothetical protein
MHTNPTCQLGNLYAALTGDLKVVGTLGNTGPWGTPDPGEHRTLGNTRRGAKGCDIWFVCGLEPLPQPKHWDKTRLIRSDFWTLRIAHLFAQSRRRRTVDSAQPPETQSVLLAMAERELLAELHSFCGI